MTSLTKHDAIRKATRKSFDHGASTRFGLQGEIYSLLNGKVLLAFTKTASGYEENSSLKGTTPISLRALPVME